MRRLKKQIFYLLLLLTPISLHSAIDQPLAHRKIVIDPGHATINSEGRIINAGRKSDDNVKEHQINTIITRKLQDLLIPLGADVILTRTDKDYWREGVSPPEDNKARAQFANEMHADIYISIHCDWYPKKKFQGITTYYFKKNSRKLGSFIHNSLVAHTKANDRGLVKDAFTILEHVNMPAILIEMGFLSHPEESRKLQDNAYQNMIAESITQGILTYFSEK